MALPVNVRRFFLPWNRPLLPQAVAFLAGDWAGGRPLDLSSLLVIVPTRQAGRRLREALAEHASTLQQAVFPPRILTPEVFLTATATPGTATPLESLLAWTEVFRQLDLGDYRDVFPIDPPGRSFAWALRLAQEFVRLQATLAEAGLQLADVTGRAGDFAEASRWRQLGVLERAYFEQLAALGLTDAQAARLAAARKPADLEGIERIVVLATPDPLPLALNALAGHARKLPVELALFAPPEEANNFDDWGRPIPAAWEHRILALPDFERQVHLAADPSAQAEKIAGVARAYGSPEGRMGIGVADSEVLPVLESVLRGAGLVAFNPEGRARRHDGFYQLLAALAELTGEPNFEAIESLARCPDIIAWLRGRQGEEFSAARWLAGLDELRARHLPADLVAARTHAGQLGRFPELAAGLAAIDELRVLLTRGEFAEAAAVVLGRIFAGRKLDLRREDDAKIEAAAAVWMETVRACARARLRFSDLSPAEWWELALRSFGASIRTDDKPAGALELQGWLELLWEDAPHLVVAGLNDGRVPEAIAGDAFLPESLREKLGLKTNAARFARDAYLLQSLAACRGESGRLDLLFGKNSAAGDPLRPSRLLMRCADPELPQRVQFLFREPERAGVDLPWTRAWQLAPRRKPAPGRVAVTALRGWLKCPLRFYFRHVLGMESVDPGKTELDAMDFGTLCHGALEAMGGDPKMRDCTDAGVLRAFLLGELERRIRARFGANLTLPLLVQLESARQRLGKAAEVQARERTDGWVIEEVERKFELPVNGLVVSGKIDRIERHAVTGAVRVLDYKTSDRAVAPPAAHLRTAKNEEPVPEWTRCDVGEKAHIWTDLQLPLYREALAAEFGGEVACGYFNLPRATGETGIELWAGYNRELHAAALRCADGICGAIRAGEFWPPREFSGREAEMDEFGALFQHGAEASVAWKEEAP